jgi:hypothetical protein
MEIAKTKSKPKAVLPVGNTTQAAFVAALNSTNSIAFANSVPSHINELRSYVAIQAHARAETIRLMELKDRGLAQAEGGPALGTLSVDSAQTGKRSIALVVVSSR